MRPVCLYTTPSAYLEDISIYGKMDGSFYWKIKARGEGSLQIRIKNPKGQEVYISEKFRTDASGVLSGEGRVENVQLWDCKHPWLYQMEAVFAGEDKNPDVCQESFGFREVHIRSCRLYLNGEPVYLKGFGKHEDSPVRGRGFDLVYAVKDIALLKWTGANSFRTSHYPYAEEMYDLCDQEGIVIIDETPAVGIASAEGKDPYQTFSIREHHEQVLRDLIARDKNHPCVVMWSMGNEPDTEHFPESAYEYWHSLYELTHQLDPADRPVTFVCCQNNYEQDLVTRTMDVICVNRYYGWYNLSGDLDAACYGLNQELDFWEKQRKPVMITEYGADAIAGIHECVAEMFSEEYQVEFYARQNAEFDKRQFFIGEHVWNFADFATIQGCMRADGNKKGLLTRDRRPKMAAHYFRKRWKDLPNFGYKG